MYETKQITGYKWNNSNAAANAQNAARVHFGIPVPDGVTTEWFNVETSYNENGSVDFYYFEGDIAPVLGNPELITVRVIEPSID